MDARIDNVAIRGISSFVPENIEENASLGAVLGERRLKKQIRLTGVKKRHTGIDLGVEHQSEVISVADGKVTFAGVQNGFGNCVEVKHVVKGVTIYSFYAHLSRIDVKAGDTVVQGQVVGLEGGATTDPNPGSSTGHHLHFEIRKASGYLNDVNPNDYFEF